MESLSQTLLVPKVSAANVSALSLRNSCSHNFSQALKLWLIGVFSDTPSVYDGSSSIQQNESLCSSAVILHGQP